MEQLNFDTIMRVCLEGKDIQVECESKPAATRARYTFYNWRVHQLKNIQFSPWTEMQLRLMAVSITGEGKNLVMFSARGVPFGEVRAKSIQIIDTGVGPIQASDNLSQSSGSSAPIPLQSSKENERSHTADVLSELGYTPE